MKPAFDIVDVDESLQAALNRDAFRSYGLSTQVPDPTSLLISDVTYVPVRTPLDDGEVIRAVRLSASIAYPIARTGAYVRLAVGLRTKERFEVLGREWDSTSDALVVGTPFDLVTEDTSIPTGRGLALRVTRSGWPAKWPSNATIEWTFGYDPGA